MAAHSRVEALWVVWDLGCSLELEEAHPQNAHHYQEEAAVAAVLDLVHTVVVAAAAAAAAAHTDL